ncbi:ABC transporter substrate-binding protein [Oenococcus alcoholitolerans]|uniref:ABC transporter substrate-binding protein n=1 Tax=Oenococcus alcoholitolerans TaxID=931074 RepID=UPI003F70309A
MNKRKTSIYYYLLAALILLFGLGYFGWQNFSAKNSESGRQQITLEFFNQKPEVAAGYQQLADLYHKQHPNVRIRMTTIGQGNGASALQAKFVAGDAPDLVMLGGLPEIDRYQSHLLTLKNLPLTKKILPSLLAGGTIKNRLVGIPVGIECYGWAYNREVFRKAGIDPEKIKTYDQFVSVVKQLDSQKSRLGLTAVFGYNGADSNVAASFAAQFLSQPFKNNLYNAYINQHLNWRNADRMKAYYSLIKRYNVKPILSVNYSNSVQDLLFNGKVAMIPQGNWIIPALDQARNGFSKNDLGMLPYFVESGNSHIMTGSSWYVGITDQHPSHVQAAKAYLSWLYNSKEAMNIIVNDMRYVPPTKNFQTSRLLDPVSKEVYRLGSGKDAIVPIHKQFPNGFTQEVLGPNSQQYLIGRISWQRFIELTNHQYYQLRQVQRGK